MTQKVLFFLTVSVLTECCFCIDQQHLSKSLSTDPLVLHSYIDIEQMPPWQQV